MSRNLLLAICCLVCLALPASATPALVGHATGGSVTVPATASFNTVGSTTKVAFVLTALTTYDVSAYVEDSEGNTFVAHDAFTATGQMVYYEFDCQGCSTSASDVFTYHTSAGSPYGLIMGMAFSGTTGFQVKASTGLSTPVSSQQPGSVTPSINGSLIVGFGSNASTTTQATVNSGMSAIDQVIGTSSVDYGGISAYIVQGTAAAFNPTFSQSGSGTPSAMIAGQIVFSPSSPPPAGSAPVISQVIN